MSQESIRQQIREMSLSLSADITDKVIGFLQTFIDPVWKENPRLHVPASAAIICQITKLPTVDNSSLTGTGIKIENVMRHLRDVRKEVFLDAIDFQLSRWPHDHHALTQKVQHTKISLRTFKKYKEIFEYLAVRNHRECVPASIREDLLAFFWIIFLLLKHSLEALQDISFSTKILVVLLEQIFSSTLCKLPIQMVRQYLYENQNFPLVGEIDPEQKALILEEFGNLLSTTLANRSVLNNFSKEYFKQNETILKRLIDDLSNIYEKEYIKLPEGRYIEEITYLQLSKNLTPQAFRVKKLDDVKPICRILNFDEDSGSQTDKNEEDSLSIGITETDKKKPAMKQISFPNDQPQLVVFSAPSFGNIPKMPESRPKQIHSITDMSPLTSGMVRNAWVNQLIKQCNSELESSLKDILGNKMINYEEFKQYCMKRIAQQVESLTSHSLNQETQKSSGWKFFVSLTKKYYQSAGFPTENTIMFVRSLLCLSGCLYNYSMRSLSIEFQKYCKIYELDLLDGFKVIYLLGKHLDVPNFIKEYLYELEKQVIIKEVWDSDSGSNLLKEMEDKKNAIILKRLHRHVYERIKQICEALQVEIKLVKKMDGLFREIVEKKIQLFQKNKLDQILMCCIVACLSINEDRNYQALGSIFFKYNFVPKVTKSDMTCPSGDQASLFDYYNRLFLPEVEEMMKKNSNTQFLFSPIRKSNLQKYKEGKNSLPPISKMFNGSPFQTGRPSIRLGGFSAGDYQKKSLDRLKKKLGESPIAQQQDSPYFGQPSLKRTMTFGNGQL